MRQKVQPAEKPIMDYETPDFWAERGCCLTCYETLKESMEGLQREVWYNGKFYDCVCYECLCSKCTWYYDGDCQRKRFSDSYYPQSI